MSQVVYCTIASANYLPQIMALRESVLRQRPGAAFEVLLCERPEVVREVQAQIGVPLVAPDEIGCTEWRRMAFYYDCMELNTALKPWFLRTLLGRGADAVVYFDPDILVYDDLAPLEEMALSSDAVLTPHLCEPLGDDGRRPGILDFNRVGQFNLGFITFRRGERTDRALRWWEDRCRTDCISDVPNGLFVDQSWANLFVSFLEARVLRSQAYNMAYWNVFQRTLRQDGERWTTGDGPLVFFHFSGLDRGAVEAVSRHQNRVRAPRGSPLHAILHDYAARLDASPWAPFRQRVYSFDAFDDGTAISPALRRRFLALSDVERRGYPDPFGERQRLQRLVEVTPATTPGAAPSWMTSVRVSSRPGTSPAYLRLNGVLKRAFPRLHAAAKDALGERVRTRIKSLFP